MLTLFLLSTAPKEQCLFETPVQLGMELKTQAVRGGLIATTSPVWWPHL